MDVRKIACWGAAGFIGVLLVTATASAYEGPRNAPQDLVVQGHRLQPNERAVSYADLNLAYRPQQRVLHGRIVRAADQICWALNSSLGSVDECSRDAVDNTRPQVNAAIQRAKLRMAGMPIPPDVAVIAFSAIR
jgi:UrcA family protein